MSPARSRQARPLILIVDDDHGMVRTLRDILIAKGFKIRVYSGREALEEARRHPCDFALIDIRMPHMNGVQLYQALRAVRCDLPAVFMTAYASEDLADEAARLGPLAILIKPIDVDRLIGLLPPRHQARLRVRPNPDLAMPA